MFSGSIVALVTPMQQDGQVAWEALDQLVDWHVEAGTNGIVAVGTTGECSTLSHAEHKQVVERVVKHSAGRIPVIAGAGANSTAEAIELTSAAHACGADAALLVTPYYNRPTQEGLFRHYEAVARAVPIAQILYNVPARTGCDLIADTVARLARLDNVVGIKEACGDVARVAQIIQETDSEFCVVSGEDAGTLIMMQLGARGVISVTANVVPQQMARFCAAMAAADYDGALKMDRSLQPLHRTLFCESSPIPVKWALADQGRIPPGIRLPMTPLNDHFHDQVRNAVGQVASI